ncbi:MAG TPA: hypothetical protein ENN21_04305 [Spirochaetes bacterium]|nr:hypothetical protein [Spirochaetota bacterium]
MKLSVELSLYPLGEARIGPIIESFIDVLKEDGLEILPGPMSTIITGETDAVFGALRKAYTAAAEKHGVVLVAKFSNACPL